MTRIGARLTATGVLLLGVGLLTLMAPVPLDAQGGQATFPAQQRPPGDPELIERGGSLYEINCRSCHGADLRGGDIGGPNLLRSQLVLNDQQGELIRPIIQQGSSTPGLPSMPPQPLSDEDARAVAEYVHSVVATARPQGAPPPGTEVELDILVGNAAAGRTYFDTHCASCHSPTGDLQGLASSVPDPKELQNTWVRGARRRGRGAPPSEATQARVTVTLSSGERVAGRLDHLDDFLVVLTPADGRQRSFTRRGDVPAVVVDDPMARHTELLSVYTDQDIHNVTAYLATLQ